MSRSVRFFEILQVLRQASTPVTAAKLAEQLEVNVRTIYRDMASLQASRIPIEGEAGIGYVLRSGFDLPPLMFNQEELEAISVGLSLLGRTGDESLMQSAESVKAKISEMLAEGRSMDMPLYASTWNRIRENAVDPKHLREMIREEVEIKIGYTNLKGEVTERVVQPIALQYFVDAIVLAAWCKLRQSFRHFRIDRIGACEPTGNRFIGHGAQMRIAWEDHLSSREN